MFRVKYQGDSTLVECWMCDMEQWFDVLYYVILSPPCYCCCLLLHLARGNKLHAPVSTQHQLVYTAPVAAEAIRSMSKGLSQQQDIIKSEQLLKTEGGDKQ